MADKLIIIATPDQREIWLRWAEQRTRWQGDDEALAYLRHAVPLVSPSGHTRRAWLPNGHIIPVPVGGGSRLFNDASSHYLEAASTPITATPFTFSAMFNSDDGTLTQAMVYMGDAGTVDNFFELAADGTLAGDPVRFRARTTGNGDAVTSTGYTTGTWHHAAGVSASATSRTAYIDGGSSGTSGSSRIPTGVDTLAIGRRSATTGVNYFSGNIAEVAIWDVALAAAQVGMFAIPISPLIVNLGSLVFYCPIIGNFSPEIDVAASRNMTVTGATVAAHPRIFYPPIQYRVGPGAAAAGIPDGSRDMDSMSQTAAMFALNY